MLENIIIPDEKKLEKIKKKIKADGKEKFHVIADFDGTLTTAFVDGKEVPSIISVLRDGNYLTSDYAPKAKEYYKIYHAIEVDPKIPLENKKAKMQEWWERHFDLLIKSGLNIKDLEKVVETGNVRFREGILELIDLLHKNEIPLIIMSSSGLGGDVISMYLRKQGRLYDTIHIISNSYKWDDKGYAVSINKPIIHSMNKDETAIKNFPVFDIIRHRMNVLLLGNSLGDIGMIKGFDCKNLIKVGFCNEKEDSLEDFEKNFDVVIVNDAGAGYVNEMIDKMI